MVRSLLFVWLIGVVAFFLLWALITMMIKRMSDKKETRKQLEESTSKEIKKETPESNTPEG